MPIYGTCPTCRSKAPIEAYLSDPDAQRALVALAERLADHPAVMRLVPGYLGLHAPTGRSMSWPKITRIINELGDLIDAGTVTYERATRPCPPAIWAAAIEEAIARRDAGKLRLPLSGHGWLISVAAGKADEDEAKRKDQRARKERGETPVGYSAAHTTAPPTDDASPVVARSLLLSERADLLRMYRASAMPAIAEQINAITARLGDGLVIPDPDEIIAQQPADSAAQPSGPPGLLSGILERQLGSLSELQTLIDQQEPNHD